MFVILNTILNLLQHLISVISLQFTFQWMLEGWFLNDICPSAVAFQMQTILFPEEGEQMILALGRRHSEMKDRQPIAPVTPVKAGWVYFISNGRRNGRSKGGI